MTMTTISTGKTRAYTNQKEAVHQQERRRQEGVLCPGQTNSVVGERLVPRSRTAAPFCARHDEKAADHFLEVLALHGGVVLARPLAAFFLGVFRQAGRMRRAPLLLTAWHRTPRTGAACVAEGRPSRGAPGRSAGGRRSRSRRRPRRTLRRTARRRKAGLFSWVTWPSPQHPASTAWKISGSFR